MTKKLMIIGLGSLIIFAIFAIVLKIIEPQLDNIAVARIASVLFALWTLDETINGN